MLTFWEYMFTFDIKQNVGHCGISKCFIQPTAGYLHTACKWAKFLKGHLYPHLRLARWCLLSWRCGTCVVCHSLHRWCTSFPYRPHPDLRWKQWCQLSSRHELPEVNLGADRERGKKWLSMKRVPEKCVGSIREAAVNWWPFVLWNVGVWLKKVKKYSTLQKQKEDMKSNDLSYIQSANLEAHTGKWQGKTNKQASAYQRGFMCVSRGCELHSH